jgi:hypothetical protein
MFCALAHSDEVCESNCNIENSQAGTAMLQHKSTKVAKTSVSGKAAELERALGSRPIQEYDHMKTRFLEKLAELTPAPTQESAPESKKCFNARAWLQRFAKEPVWRRYSQGDQDAVLASLFAAENLGTTDKKFVEFGFPDKDFSTSYGNGRYLREGLGFESHLLMDGMFENPDVNLRKRFVTAANVVSIFDEFKVPLKADYISVDIDSCDVWVAHAILEKYRPRVMTVEYNSNYPFGDYTTQKCAAPEAEGAYLFSGDNIFGASMSAIALSAKKRGYSVVYVSSRLDVFLIPDELVCPGTAVPIETFKPATNLPLHGKYEGQFGPKENLLTNFSNWLSTH